MWQNVHAKNISDLSDFRTKKALKDAIPADVVFYGTGMDNRNVRYIADDLVVGVKYSIAGPNPYTNRKWYATVEKLANGTIKVS